MISKIFGVSEGGVVENEEIRKASEDKVDEQAEDPDEYWASATDRHGKKERWSECLPNDQIQAQRLPTYTVAGPCAHICPCRGLQTKKATGGRKSDGCLRHARESDGGIVDSVVRQDCRGGSREIFRIQTVEEEGVEDLKDDIHDAKG